MLGSGKLTKFTKIAKMTKLTKITKMTKISKTTESTVRWVKMTKMTNPPLKRGLVKHFGNFKTSSADSARERFARELSFLAGSVGSRNQNLVKVARYGLWANIAPDDIVAAIVDNGGTPPLTRAEAQRAVHTAQATEGMAQTAFRKAAPVIVAADPFVSEMIKAGQDCSTMQDLAALSPVRMMDGSTEGDRRAQLGMFLDVLFGDDETIFIGNRTDTAVRTLRDWKWMLFRMDADKWPMLIGANPVSGKAEMTADGHASYRCKAAVCSSRYALIEFDAMPLADQCRFWAGVISLHRLPVVSIVYSGHRSLHALLTLEEADYTIHNWDDAWQKLSSFLCCSGNPPEHRADIACRDCSRLTRLPGSRRDGGEVQRLVYLRDIDSRTPPFSWEAPAGYPKPEEVHEDWCSVEEAREIFGLEV